MNYLKVLWDDLKIVLIVISGFTIIGALSYLWEMNPVKAPMIAVAIMVVTLISIYILHVYQKANAKNRW